jgi:LPS export ABC transporter protein LptC
LNPLRVFSPLILLAVLSGCRINYDLAGGEADDGIPDIYMEGLTQIQTSRDRNTVVLTADKASIFTEEGETIFESLSFRETGDKGELLRRGTAGEARLKDNDDADLSGGVMIESYEDEVLFEGEAFSWKDKTQLLTAPDEGAVRMVRKDKTEIAGSGFHADFRLNEIGFDRAVRGVITVEE